MYGYDWDKGVEIMSNTPSPYFRHEVRMHAFAKRGFKNLGHWNTGQMDRLFVPASKNGPEFLEANKPDFRRPPERLRHGEVVNGMGVRECRKRGGHEDLRHRARIAGFKLEREARERREAAALSSYVPESSATRRASRASRESADEIPAHVRARMEETESFTTLDAFLKAYKPDNATLADPLEQDGEDLDALSMYELCFRQPTIHDERDRARVDELTLKMYDWAERKREVCTGVVGKMHTPDTGRSGATPMKERRKSRRGSTPKK